MTTPILTLPDWAAEQETPWTTMNKVSRMVEAMARRGIVEDRDLYDPPASCADGACYLVAATGGGAWNGQTGKMAIAVGTNASNGWYFVTVANEGTRLYVRDENLEILHNGSAWVNGNPALNDLSDVNVDSRVDGYVLTWDETNEVWYAAPQSGLTQYYRFGFFFTTTPTSSEVLLLHTFSDAVSFSDDFAGEFVADIGTNPTASFAMDVQKNGVSAGTITISTGGSITIATSGGALSFAAGDQIKVVAPGSADATCANFSGTFKGTI